MPSEWAKYDFQVGGRSAAVLTDVNHVAHLAEARAVVDAGQVTARPVYDESRLNKTRAHVCWASANFWSNGSMYGTVEFTFPWAQLVAGREIYWVEAIEKYNPTAYRFLITDRKPPSAPGVAPYDATSENGPLKRVADVWHWNGDLTAEFMIEGPLLLSLCQKVSFVTHHPSYCRLNGTKCPEIKSVWTKSAARFVGYLLGTRSSAANAALLPDVGLPHDRPSLTSIEAAYSGLYFALGGKPERFGGKVRSIDGACRLVRAALLQYAFEEDEDARATIAMIESEPLFRRALRRLLASHFDIPRKWLP